MFNLTQAEGHLIGNHIYSHIQLRKGNREAFKEELIKTNEIIKEITGENDIILMHDYYDTSVTAALKAIDKLQEKGYTFVTVDEILFD